MHSFYRTVGTAFSALRRHMMRSALTGLGIVIGVAAVIVMVEIGQGSSYAIGQTIASIGANVVQIDPADVFNAGVSSGGGGRVTLTPADCDAIRNQCSSIRWAAPSVDCSAQITYGNRNWSPGRILGTTPDFLLIRNWSDLTQGQSFTDNDVRCGAAVCLVGQTIVRELFAGESPLGKEIRMKGIRMKVVGVLQAKGASMTGRDQDDYVIAPWTTIKYRLSGQRAATATGAIASLSQVNTINGLYPTQSVTLYPKPSAAQLADLPQMVRFTDLDDIWVSAAEPEDVPLAMDQVTVLLQERHQIGEDEDNDFRIRDLTEISRSLASTQKLMTRLLLYVALISLMVGGVGIMNIMLASVTERTREIGLRMAVGAKASDILRQFLTEAVILCLLGGITGILLGRGASMAVTAFLQWRTIPSWPATAAAFGVSAAVGIIFGYYPAWKASRLDPIVALRYE